MGMVGKRVGIFHDIRLKPGQWYGENYDPGGIDPESQQLLLELISGDLTEIGRKYIEAWKGLPFIKFELISNKVPNFNDEVLITRFITIEFTKSYLDNENKELKRCCSPPNFRGSLTTVSLRTANFLSEGSLSNPIAAKHYSIGSRLALILGPPSWTPIGSVIPWAKEPWSAFSTQRSVTGVCKLRGTTW
jgi:hypothetical protein